MLKEHLCNNYIIYNLKVLKQLNYQYFKVNYDITLALQNFKIHKFRKLNFLIIISSLYILIKVILFLALNIQLLLNEIIQLRQQLLILLLFKS